MYHPSRPCCTGLAAFHLLVQLLVVVVSPEVLVLGITVINIISRVFWLLNIKIDIFITFEAFLEYLSTDIKQLKNVSLRIKGLVK